MSLVQTIHITRLGGFTGSNPELMAQFPIGIAEMEEKTIIDNSLPVGIKPDSFSLEKIGNNYFLSYIFAITGDEVAIREDLASISVVIDNKNIDIEHFKVLFEHIVEIMIKQTELKITMEFLIESLEKIYEGINKNKKVKLSGITIDIPKIINQKKLKITKKREVKGRVF